MASLAKDMRVEEYKVIYDAMMAKGGIYPKNLCMDEPPFMEEDQVELVKHQVNKMVKLVYIPLLKIGSYIKSRRSQSELRKLKLGHRK